MQVYVTRKDAKTLEITSEQPDQLTVACLEVGGVLKMGLKVHVSEMEIGKTMLVDTKAVKPL